jgi:hypothetical protein
MEWKSHYVKVIPTLSRALENLFNLWKEVNDIITLNTALCPWETVSLPSTSLDVNHAQRCFTSRVCRWLVVSTRHMQLPRDMFYIASVAANSWRGYNKTTQVMRVLQAKVRFGILIVKNEMWSPDSQQYLYLIWDATRELITGLSTLYWDIQGQSKPGPGGVGLTMGPLQQLLKEFTELVISVAFF